MLNQKLLKTEVDWKEFLADYLKVADESPPASYPATLVWIACCRGDDEIHHTFVYATP